MGKFYEKKNFGIPVTILIVFAYLIGYSLTKSLSGTLVAALLFAAAVFAFDFDERVKNAVKHSYVFAFLFQLIFFVLEFISDIIVKLIYGGTVDLSSLSDIFFSARSYWNVQNYFLSVLTFIVNAAVIVIYAICIIMAFAGKDVRIGFIANMLGEVLPKNNFNRPQTNYYNQQVPPAQNMRPSAPNSQYTVHTNAPNNPSVQNVYPQAPVNPQGPNSHGYSQGPGVQATDVQGQSPYTQSQPTGQPNTQQAPNTTQTSGSTANICPNCGKANHSNAIYCAACGTKLK